MKLAFRLVVAAALILALLPGTAAATHVPDQSSRMAEIFTSPNQATNSDLAFWGNHAFVGYYTGDTGFPPGSGPRGGVRIFDISDPASPRLIRDFRCDGLQNDPFVLDTDDNGVADLMLLAVDRTMDAPDCGAARSMRTNAEGEQVAFHENPTGWEGVRVFRMSDNPNRPFTAIEQVAAVYTDCGAHTITGWTGNVDEGELIVYVSSYPLRPGPTCGVTGSTTTPPWQNTENPYDADPQSPGNPLHGVVQVIRVPLDDPENSEELPELPVSYPGDPDSKIDWTERGFTGLEPEAVACHDIVVHMERNLAGGACAEQGQVWNIDPDTGMPDTQNPIMVADDELSSGGSGQIPGAVDFFHSTMFNNEGTIVNWVDESFGSGCPTMTDWQQRPWHPAGTHKTGRLFFTDLEGNFLSDFQVGDVRPDPGPTEYCSAHMGMAVPGINRDLLVNAHYTGGVNVIDFTRPTRLREIAYYDPQRDSGTWSAYPYTGPLFRTGGGVPVYASDGVENNEIAQGMVVYRTRIQRPGRRNLVDHLNPQTMDWTMDRRGRGKDKRHKGV